MSDNPAINRAIHEIWGLCTERNKLSDEIDDLRAALKATTDELIGSWERRDLAPDRQLELVESNLKLLNR